MSKVRVVAGFYVGRTFDIKQILTSDRFVLVWFDSRQVNYFWLRFNEARFICEYNQST